MFIFLAWFIWKPWTRLDSWPYCDTKTTIWFLSSFSKCSSGRIFNLLEKLVSWMFVLFTGSQTVIRWPLVFFFNFYKIRPQVWPSDALLIRSLQTLPVLNASPGIWKFGNHWYNRSHFILFLLYIFIIIYIFL